MIKVHVFKYQVFSCDNLTLLNRCESFTNIRCDVINLHLVSLGHINRCNILPVAEINDPTLRDNIAFIDWEPQPLCRL